MDSCYPGYRRKPCTRQRASRSALPLGDRHITVHLDPAVFQCRQISQAMCVLSVGSVRALHTGPNPSVAQRKSLDPPVNPSATSRIVGHHGHEELAQVVELLRAGGVRHPGVDAEVHVDPSTLQELVRGPPVLESDDLIVVAMRLEHGCVLIDLADEGLVSASARDGRFTAAGQAPVNKGDG